MGRRKVQRAATAAAVSPHASAQDRRADRTADGLTYVWLGCPRAHVARLVVEYACKTYNAKPRKPASTPVLGLTCTQVRPVSVNLLPPSTGGGADAACQVREALMQALYLVPHTHIVTGFAHARGSLCTWRAPTRYVRGAGHGMLALTRLMRPALVPTCRLASPGGGGEHQPGRQACQVQGAAGGHLLQRGRAVPRVHVHAGGVASHRFAL